MATLFERRVARQKREETKIHEANKRNKSKEMTEAKALRRELAPRMFVNIERITDDLLKHGYMDVQSSFFTVNISLEYFKKVNKATQLGRLLGKLLDSKVILISKSDEKGIKEIQAREGYILDEVAEYLAEHEIGIVPNEYETINPYRLFILE